MNFFSKNIITKKELEKNWSYGIALIIIGSLMIVFSLVLVLVLGLVFLLKCNL